MYKYGKVTIVGKPNVGKSTLLNYLVGEKISIVSPKAQTTRDVINGVLTTNTAQIVFVDTPGTVKASTALNKYMAKGIKASTIDVDVILYLIDGLKPLNDNDVQAIEQFAAMKSSIIVCITKLDRADKSKLIPIVSKIGEINNIKAIIPISTFRKTNIDDLMNEIEKYLPEGEKMFGDDFLTDKPYRFLISERIREKVLYRYNEEIPHGITIDLPKLEFDEDKNMYTIYADIICEKQSHKGIIIGKGGLALKEIATKARQDLERLLDAKVFLTLFVKVKENWRERESLVTEFGYNKKNYDM